MEKLFTKFRVLLFMLVFLSFVSSGNGYAHETVCNEHSENMSISGNITETKNVTERIDSIDYFFFRSLDNKYCLSKNNDVWTIKCRHTPFTIEPDITAYTPKR